MVILSPAASGHIHIFYCTGFIVGLPDEQGEQKNGLSQQAGSSTGIAAGQLAAGHVGCILLPPDGVMCSTVGGKENAHQTLSIPGPEAAGPSSSTHPRSRRKQGQGGPDDEREAGSASDDSMDRQLDSSDEEDVDQEEIGEVISTYQWTLGHAGRVARSTRYSCTLHRLSSTERLVCSPEFCGLIVSICAANLYASSGLLH